MTGTSIVVAIQTQHLLYGLGAVLFIMCIILIRFILTLKKKNQLLREQSKQIDSLSDEKAKLLSIVSHDLKSPYNRVYALINLLKMDEGSLSPDQLDYLSKMYQVVKDGMWLIRNLLDMRAIERETIDPDTIDMELNKFLKSILHNLKPLAEIKKLKFSFKTNKESIHIRSDKHYLMRVFENVISNSMKFSESGEEISIEVNDKTGFAEVKINDHGPGLSNKDQQNLYKKYEPLSAKPTDGESATGLGLFVTKEIINKLGGTIQCNGDVENGASFSIRIPTVV